MGDGGCAVAYSPDGQTVLIGLANMTAQLWDVATRKPVGPLLQHQASVIAVAFHPGGRMVLTASYDGTVRLWQAKTGRSIGPPLQHEGDVSAAVFSPDGRSILTGCNDHTARLWSVPDPVAGEAEQIRLWTQVITGMELDDESAIRPLDASTWHERSQRLNELGGPPMP
jgi:WD40 repeat protein